MIDFYTNLEKLSDSNLSKEELLNNLVFIKELKKILLNNYKNFKSIQYNHNFDYYKIDYSKYL